MTHCIVFYFLAFFCILSYTLLALAMPTPSVLLNKKTFATLLSKYWCFNSPPRTTLVLRCALCGMASSAFFRKHDAPPDTCPERTQSEGRYFWLKKGWIKRRMWDVSVKWRWDSLNYGMRKFALTDVQQRSEQKGERGNGAAASECKHNLPDPLCVHITGL